jgi:hypothetical protein
LGFQNTIFWFSTNPSKQYLSVYGALQFWDLSSFLTKKAIMENLDIILLTAVVAIAFIAFIATTLKEFSVMENETYTFDKNKTTYGRDALFDILQKAFEDETIPQKERKALLKTIDKSMSDMETDGVYFTEEIKEKLKAKLVEKIGLLPTTLPNPETPNPSL